LPAGLDAVSTVRAACWVSVRIAWRLRAKNELRTRTAEFGDDPAFADVQEALALAALTAAATTPVFANESGFAGHFVSRTLPFGDYRILVVTMALVRLCMAFTAALMVALPGRLTGLRHRVLRRWQNGDAQECGNCAAARSSVP
jgi:hypothetical protein